MADEVVPNEERLNDDIEETIQIINVEKQTLSSNEQNLVDLWIARLTNDVEDDASVRRAYVNLLKGQLQRDDKHLSWPYLNEPPVEPLQPLREVIAKVGPGADQADQPERAKEREQRRYFCSKPDKKVPCHVVKPSSCAKKPDRMRKCPRNEFENVEEMARCIAKSKGMMLAEFVADISRHTSDKGCEMRAAMKEEIARFNESVERIITQRIKDLTEFLDNSQTSEVMKVQKEYDKWQSELSVCKKKIKEIIPGFDFEAYHKDENYLKNLFTLTASDTASEDRYKEWRDENCHRLLWYYSEIDKITDENNKVLEEISYIKSKTLELKEKLAEKQRCHEKYIEKKCSKYKALKEKSDTLARSIADMILSLKN